jgi:hypothetical protein
MADFDLFFEILPGTKGPSVAADLNEFEVGQIGKWVRLVKATSRDKVAR